MASAAAPGGGPPDRELYAILNLSADATEEEIKRSYRQLVTTYHPDKARDPALQAEAGRAFNRIQEAYEVLSDPARRDVYDVYGAEGLSAGLQLSDPGKSRDELRREFEAFRERRRRDALEAAVNYRGLYVFRVNASALVAPYAQGLPRVPELSNIYMTSGVDVPIEAAKDWGWLGSEQDVLHLGGMVSVRGDAGGGSFLAGYKRVFSDYSSLELHAAAGLKSLLSLQSSVQLSQAASASLIATWQPSLGPGLQLVTSRQLSDDYSGELSWVIGPREAAGMSLGITRRKEKSNIVARLEVGAVTAIALRAGRQLTELSAARLGIKFGTTGVELDIGATRRLSEISTVGLSVVTGLQGVMLRLKYSRAGHLFEFPILLSPALDAKILASAYLGPPAAVYVAKEWILGPISRMVVARRARAERQRKALQIQAALGEAAAAARLMGPVAKRRVRKEAAAGGLVIVLALYGEEAAVKAAAQERLTLAAAAEPPAPQPQSGAAAAAAVSEVLRSPRAGSSSSAGGGVQAHPLHDVASPHVGAEAEAAAAPSSAAEGGPGSGTGGGQAAEGPAPPAASPPAVPAADEELPPPLADVTVAVQYLCEASKVVLHQGYPKSALMGFCDPAPGAAKLLLVFFTFKGRPLMARVGEFEGAQLPTRGELVSDPQVAALVAAAAQKLKAT